MSSPAPSIPARAKGALDGLLVIDLSRVLAGPFATMQLADLGARVIKIERKGVGDDTRAWGPPFHEGPDGARASTYFLAVNRNKESLALDLKTPAGLAHVKELAREADVLIHNFPRATQERLGLDLDGMRADNPRLVTCSISGFGDDSDRPGYDALLQAEMGLMSMTGSADGPPTKVGVAVADVFAGHSAATAILAALFHRERTGCGQHIEIALCDALLQALVNQAQAALSTGRSPKRLGSAHPSIVPYRPFDCADEPLMLAVGTDAQFGRFCRLVIEDEALASDLRFMTNVLRVEHRVELERLIAGHFARRARDEWLEACERARIPASPIRGLVEALNDPRTFEREMRVKVMHETLGEIEVIGSPMKLKGTPPRIDRAPPVLGD